MLHYVGGRGGGEGACGEGVSFSRASWSLYEETNEAEQALPLKEVLGSPHSFHHVKKP